MEILFIVVTCIFALSLIVFISQFVFGLKSARDGAQLSMEFHRTANTPVQGVRPRIFFAFRFWPLTSNMEQNLPWFNANVKRLPMMLTVIEWSLIGKYRSEGNGKYWKMVFFGTFGKLLIVIGMVAALFSVVDSGAQETIVLISGILLIGIGLMLVLYPIRMVIREGIPIIENMNISEIDKTRLKRIIKLGFVVVLAGILMDVIRLIRELKGKE